MMDNVLPSLLQKLTGLKSWASALVLGVILVLTRLLSVPILGGLALLALSIRVYWSLGPDRMRVRWLFFTLVLAAYGSILSMPPGALEIILLFLGFSLSIWATIAILEFKVSDGNLWYRSTATLALWGIGAVALSIDSSVISPFMVFVCAALLAREYLRLQGMNAPRHPILLGAVQGIVGFELFRFVSILPFGPIRGAGIIALILGFLSDVVARQYADRGTMHWVFTELLFVVFGVLLLSAISPWDLP